MSALLMPLALLALLLFGQAGPVRADEDGSGSGEGSGWDAAPLLCLPPAQWDALLGLCVDVGKGARDRVKPPLLSPEGEVEWNVKEELFEEILVSKESNTSLPTGEDEETSDDKEEINASQERDYWKEDSVRREEEEVEEMEEDELERERVQVEKITSLLEELKDEEQSPQNRETSRFIGSKLWIYMSVGVVTITGLLAILAITIKYRKSAVAAIKENSRPNPTVAKLLRQSPESKPILDEQEERLV